MTGNQADNGFLNKLSGKKTVLKAAGELFCSAYLLLMFGIYPFYMENGYVDIGEAKYLFLYTVRWLPLQFSGRFACAAISRYCAGE